jgi:hypothetical protein
MTAFLFVWAVLATCGCAVLMFLIWSMASNAKRIVVRVLKDVMADLSIDPITRERVADAVLRNPEKWSL